MHNRHLPFHHRRTETLVMTSRSSLAWIEEETKRRQAKGLWRTLRKRHSPHVGGLIQVDGRTCLDFSANDYLSLAADPRLIDTVRRVAGACGWGSGASPLVSGYGVWHERLERELAAFEQTEAALLFPSGYAANIAAVTALVERGDLILSDELNHASIVDGCRLSRAEVLVYRHGDVAHARELIAGRRNAFRRAILVTDSVFSMDGDSAPLSELAQLAEEFDAMLVVDEAHATGVFGSTGRGVVEQLQLHDRMAVRVGTLSKALGSIGGFICGSRTLVEWIRNRGRTQFYSTAMPEAAAAAGVEALRIVGTEPQRRQRLWENINGFADLLSSRGLPVRNPSPIVPIVIGDSQRALQVAESLLNLGILVPAIREPTVPAGTARLRISLCHDHTRDQLQSLADALAALCTDGLLTV